MTKKNKLISKHIIFIFDLQKKFHKTPKNYQVPNVLLNILISYRAYYKI